MRESFCLGDGFRVYADRGRLTLLQRVLDADRDLDHRLWLRAVASLIADADAGDQIELFRSAALRIRSAYRLPHRRRQDAIAALAQACPVLQI